MLEALAYAFFSLVYAPAVLSAMSVVLPVLCIILLWENQWGWALVAIVASPLVVVVATLVLPALMAAIAAFIVGVSMCIVNVILFVVSIHELTWAALLWLAWTGVHVLVALDSRVCPTATDWRRIVHDVHRWTDVFPHHPPFFAANVGTALVFWVTGAYFDAAGTKYVLVGWMLIHGFALFLARAHAREWRQNRLWRLAVQSVCLAFMLWTNAVFVCKFREGVVAGYPYWTIGSWSGSSSIVNLGLVSIITQHGFPHKYVFLGLRADWVLLKDRLGIQWLEL